MAETSPFLKEIEEIVRNNRNKRAVVYYETENIVRELQYGQISEISLKIRGYIEDFVQNCCVGLAMDHNPFIPSIIMCLQNLNCSFAFLKCNDNLNEMKEFFNDIKIIISLNKQTVVANYTLATTVNLLWEHKLYFYKLEGPREISFDQNINYIIRTSGTTGLRKVVKVEHYCIYSNIRCLRSKLNIKSLDVIYFGTILTFDPSIIELYLALTTGASLLIVSKAIKGNLSKLYKILFKNTIRENNITFLQMCPSVFLRWNDKEIDYILNRSELKILLLGGEIFPKTLQSAIATTKTKIYNIYGITEVSCWASIEEFRPGNKISLGDLLDDTIFEVRNEDGLKISEGEGELYIGSNKRICYINNETIIKNKPIFRKTGDLVHIRNNRIYCSGRTNDVFKRFGIRVNSNCIENKIFDIVQLENKLIYLEDEMKLFLFVKLNILDQSTILRACDKIRVKLLHSLEKEHFPDRIRGIQEFPVNDNGKIEMDKLRLLAKEVVDKENLGHQNMGRYPKNSIDEVEIFNNLWRKYFKISETSSEANCKDSNKTFYDLGGTSVLRIQFSNEYKELIRNNEIPTYFFDYIFENSYKEATEFIKNYKFKRKLIDTERCVHEQYIFDKKIKLSEDGIKMKVKWSYDLKGCVDTTPCIIPNKQLVAIGAFSNNFVVLNTTTGTEILKIVLPNSIENSCLSTSCAKKIFLGCYDGNLYCVDVDDKNIIWSYQTDDKIKNKPCFVNGEKEIVFGSYDKHLYCLETETGRLLWKTFLNSPITAATLFLEKVDSIFAATLNGTCFSIDRNGSILWNVKFDSPIFSSPEIFCDNNQTGIIIAEVKGIVHFLNYRTEKIVWRYKVHNHIYSSIKLHKNLIFLTCHDHFLYCLEIFDNDVKFKFKIGLDSASSSRVEVLMINDKEYLITASINGFIYLIDLCEQTIVDALKLNGEIFSSPAIYISSPAECGKDKDSSIFIGCRDDSVYCIELVDDVNNELS